MREAYVRAGRARVARRLPGEPIVICGCGRSGTTLLLAILDAHPHLLGVDESHSFGPFAPDAGPAASAAPRPPKLYRLYRHLLFRRIPRRARRYCVKRPSSVLDIPRILAFFDGRVRIVHLVRDARAVCTSRHPRRPDAYWVPVERWVEDVRAGLAYAEHPRVHTLRYEDLVSAPEPTLRALFAFLEEPADALPREWERHSSIRRAKAWFGELRGLSRRGLERWDTAADRARVRAIEADPAARALLARFGYALSAEAAERGRDEAPGQRPPPPQMP